MMWFPTLFRRGVCVDALLVAIASQQRSILNSERRIMTALEDLNTKVDALAAQLTDANAKTDKLIGLTTDLEALVKQFQSAVPITDADVQAVIDKIGAISTSVAAETVKEDAAIAAASPAPAPTPVAATVADTQTPAV